MSSIDPALALSRSNSVVGLDQQNLDPATILLALSMGQLGVLQDSLVSRVPTLKDTHETLGRIGAAGSKLGQLQTAVLRGEQQEAEDLLKQLEAFKTRHLSGDQSQLVVNDAQQQDLSKVLEWAQQRGFPMTELLKEVPVPKPAKSEAEQSSEGQPAAEEPIETQTVVDGQAFMALHDRLKNYLTQLKTGEVDNPAIRHRLANHVDHDGLVSELAGLGLNTDLESLGQLQSAITELDSRFNQIVKESQQTVGQAKLLVREMEKSVRELGDLSKSQVQIDNRATDRQQADEQDRLQSLDLDRQKRAQLDEIETVIRSAEAILQQLEESRLLEMRPSVELPVSAQLDVEARLADWTAALNKQLEAAGELPRPEHRPLRPASVYV
jgi:hypothetical protein